MSLSQRIDAALDELEARNDFPAPLRVEEAGQHLALDVEQSTPVGISCRNLEFAAPERAPWSLDDLKAWGQRLSARLTYLMEPLSVHEADVEAVEVRLRSQIPTPRDGRRSYYEITLDRAGTLRLARYHFDEAERLRKPASIQLTREVLLRLADDLAASVS